MSATALRRYAILIALLSLASCAQLERRETGVASDVFRLANDPSVAPWQAVPIRFKTPTQYGAGTVDQVPCILAVAEGSWSLQAAAVPQAFATASKLTWRWNVENLLPGADSETRGNDDSPARVIIAFNGDKSTINAADRAAMNMAKLLGGWDIPYASIQYIWESDTLIDTVIPHHTISRIKKIVVKSGPSGLKSWLDFERDVRADFRRAFPGEEPGAIESIGIMTDADSLGGATRACYADLALR
jgi:hypothetical protein